MNFLHQSSNIITYIKIFNYYLYLFIYRDIRLEPDLLKRSKTAR